MEAMLIAGVLALIVVAAAAGFEVGRWYGQAFAYRLHRHDVNLDRWYAEEPKIRTLALAHQDQQQEVTGG